MPPPNAPIGYEPGVRIPTGHGGAAGWPQPQPQPQPYAQAPGQWPPAPGQRPPAPGQWQSAPDQRPPAPDQWRSAPGQLPAPVGPGQQSAPPPAEPRRGSGRRYVLLSVVFILVAAGVGGAAWRGGWLTRAKDQPAVAHPANAAAAPSASAVPQAASSAAPSATPSAAPVVVDKGAGTFTYVATEGKVLGTAGPVRRFRIAIENGINQDPTAFAAFVDQTLGDPRSWIASGQFRLQRVTASTPAEFTIYLASPTTSESMCAKGGLQTEKFTSCRIPGQVIINDARWLTAIPDYGAPLEIYQAYAINHEVGHQLGHGHEACPGPGQLAPVMQQQTYGLKGCVANAWPFVNGKRYAGAPVP